MFHSYNYLCYKNQNENRILSDLILDISLFNKCKYNTLHFKNKSTYAFVILETKRLLIFIKIELFIH